MLDLDAPVRRLLHLPLRCLWMLRVRPRPGVWGWPGHPGAGGEGDPRPPAACSPREWGWVRGCRTLSPGCSTRGCKASSSSQDPGVRASCPNVSPRPSGAADPAPAPALANSRVPGHPFEGISIRRLTFYFLKGHVPPLPRSGTEKAEIE